MEPRLTGVPHGPHQTTRQEGEDRAEQFFRRYGLDVESIPETDTKTPDFRVSDIHGFVFYVEVKSIDPYPEEDGLIWDGCGSSAAAISQRISAG